MNSHAELPASDAAAPQIACGTCAEAPEGSGLWLTVVVGLALTLAAILLQDHNEAGRSDFGADPDEPAHVVTGLMMRDYFVSGLWHGEPPMRFAQAYYDHFPKVALGHYPPGFYMLAGLWLLPFPTKSAWLLLMALLCGGGGALTFHLARRCGLSTRGAIGASVAFVLLPLTQQQTMLVMSDLLLCLCMLLATAAWAKFCDEEKARHALGFGLWAAAAILTKASGMALAALPPAAMLLLGRWRWLRNGRFWLAAVPVVLTALPWTLLTLHITEEGMMHESITAYIPKATAYYANAARWSLGPVLLAGGGACLTIGLVRWLTRKQPPDALPLLLGVLPGAVLLLYLVSPSGMSERYLLPVVPSVAIGTFAIAGMLVRRMQRRMPSLPTCFLENYGYAALVIAIISNVPWPHPKQMLGYSEMGTRLLQEAPRGKVLVIADSRGEGALTAEVALRVADRVHSPWTIVRGSKLLAESDWLGRNYEVKIADTEQLASRLQDEGIEWLVVDAGIPEDQRPTHFAATQHWLDMKPAGITAVASLPSRRSAREQPAHLDLFHLPPAPPKP